MTPYELGQAYAIKTATATKTARNYLNFASKIAPATEVAGLGMLAVPTVYEMNQSPWLMSEKKRQALHWTELGGLGVLAGPSLYKLLSKAR